MLDSKWGLSVFQTHCACVLTDLTSSVLQVATLLAVSPRTSGSSWQCLSQHRATRWGGEADMPGENTDSWRACWREMASGDAAKRRNFDEVLTLCLSFTLKLKPFPSPISSLT